jgi:hypothetical protein
MHDILLLIAIGLVIVGIMLAVCMLLKLPRDQALGRAVFSWFVGAAIYTGLNISSGEASVLDELTKFFPIFGIPAAAAYGLSRFMKN